ncbi:DUF3302 domain-containing protein [Desulforhopalus sp. 52FAK]
MGDRTLDYVALCVLIFVVLTIIYGIIYIHDIPYEIAKKRKHPHQDAIHTAGWVSLFLMHTIWPFLWIWATLYKHERGWGLAGEKPKTENPIQDQLQLLENRISELEAQRKKEESNYVTHLKQLNQELQQLRKSPRKGEDA